MRITNLIVYIPFLVSSLPLLAHEPQIGKISATPGLMIYRTRTDKSIPAKESPYLLGGGLIVEADLNDIGGLEIAMLYKNKYYLRNDDDGFAVEKIKRMYITTGYRYWWRHWVSLAGTFYSSYSMGDPRIIERKSDTDAKYLTSAQRITEYGLDFSVQWDIYNKGNYTLIADTRYAVSLTHKPHEQADTYGILIGVKYEIPKELMSGRPAESTLDPQDIPP